jgi:hypothetical protein
MFYKSSWKYDDEIYLIDERLLTYAVAWDVSSWCLNGITSDSCLEMVSLSAWLCCCLWGKHRQVLCQKPPTSLLLTTLILNVKCSENHMMIVFCSFAGACQLVMFWTNKQCSHAKGGLNIHFEIYHYFYHRVPKLHFMSKAHQYDYARKWDVWSCIVE